MDPQLPRDGQGEFRPLPPHSLTAGKVVIKLHTDKVRDEKATKMCFSYALATQLCFLRQAPKAAENFKCLCTGERGKGKSSGKPLHFKVRSNWV